MPLKPNSDSQTFLKALNHFTVQFKLANHYSESYIVSMYFTYKALITLFLEKASVLSTYILLMFRFYMFVSVH